MKRPASLALAACLGLALAGCATPPRDPAERAAFEANHDPLEPLNRKIFAFNQAFDRCLVKPVAKTYVRVVPAPGRAGLHNFIQNLGEPIVLGNDLLQADFRRAAKTAGRFLIDSTIGIGGIIDVADSARLPQQTGDFGQTLHAWGWRGGPYLVLPLFGPSDPRDAVGQGVDVFLDPLRFVADNANYPTGLSAAKTIASGIDERSRNLGTLDELERESIDYYAALRSLYRQNRAAVLGEKTQTPAAPSEGFYSDPGASQP